MFTCVRAGGRAGERAGGRAGGRACVHSSRGWLVKFCSAGRADQRGDARVDGVVSSGAGPAHQFAALLALAHSLYSPPSGLPKVKLIGQTGHCVPGAQEPVTNGTADISCILTTVLNGNAAWRSHSRRRRRWPSVEYDSCRGRSRRSEA